MVEQPGLSRTRSETLKTGFLTTRLICFPCRLTKAEEEQHAAVVEKTVLEQKYRGEIETAKVGTEEKQLGGGGVVFKALLIALGELIK